MPGLTLLGALVSFVAATHVFTPNTTYDVPVKLFSFHLVLMSLALLAPDCRRLMNVLVLNRNNFRLVQSKFRWIQDVPFNR